MSLDKLKTMHMEDLRSMEVHSIDQRSWRRPRNDGGYIPKDLKWQCGDVVHAPSGLVWKMREDRAMGSANRSKTKDKWGRQTDIGQRATQCQLLFGCTSLSKGCKFNMMKRATPRVQRVSWHPSSIEETALFLQRSDSNDAPLPDTKLRSLTSGTVNDYMMT
jgi:hypothetical protein